jgi:hypothetical protein
MRSHTKPLRRRLNTIEDYLILDGQRKRQFVSRLIESLIIRLLSAYSYVLETYGEV